MSKKITCISIDLINADKPPAALAFMAGACEKVNADYQCISLNSVFYHKLSQKKYNDIYSNVKIGNIENFFPTVGPVVQKVIEHVKNFNNNLIMISVFSYMQYQLAEFFLQLLREQIPNVEIIAGGPGIGHEMHGMTNGRRLLEKNLIDFYCLGEGDEVLVNFLKGSRSELGLNSNSNFYESWTPQINDLDKHYVFPSYKKIESGNYKNLENKNSTVFSLSTSRGCVRSCTFCDVGKTWKKFKFRSGSNVVDEVIKHHQDIGAVHFTIVDSLINGSLKSFQDFNLRMTEVKQQYPGLKDFSYNGMFIVRDRHSHKEDLFKIMKQAGCDSLSIGVETGSDHLRAQMNKQFTNKDLDYHLEMCDKYGIRNSLFMFVGYPTETAKDFEESVAMLYKYQRYLINDTIIGINHSGIFSMLPDTPSYDHRQELGIEIVEDTSNTGILNWINHNNLELTVKERILRDLEFRQHALDLRYPVPYASRYLEYLSKVHPEFVPQSD
jgi:radical SAM superfamily enzyme YgiQ (UPF0313 family)